ncbi:RCC1 domain-containing protein 1 isoform X3 [Melospiza georgiana]|uniref:RCC1 domain-containing protein 1 isoform X3 n=1 Tax=Melospiza georgiana TaxID=44398 RepID=UPI0025AB636A|nr:RCC1 domain-containing protein 1 isoform X3 [Melospiza georgiana]
MLPRPNRHRSAAELLPPAPPAPAPSLTRAAPGAVSRCCPRTPGCSWCCGAGHHSLPGAWLFLGLILLSCGCSLSCSGSASLELGWWQQEGLGGVCGQEAGAVCGGLCVCLSVRLSVRVCPCRHGQLGHGQLEAELQPRLVEALAGVPMRAVAAGGWHSASVSEAGDLYMWGWNESGQLALPSKALAEERARDEDKGAGSTKLMPCQEQLAAQDAAFISIQAFPALLDLPQDLEEAGSSTPGAGVSGTPALGLHNLPGSSFWFLFSRPWLFCRCPSSVYTGGSCVPSLPPHKHQEQLPCGAPGPRCVMTVSAANEEMIGTAPCLANHLMD